MPDNIIMLEKIVGKDNVYSDQTTLAFFSKDCSFTNKRSPRLVVRPKNTQEVQRIVQWANETLTALVPVSSEGPHFNGDTIPEVEGTVIVDLTRMKKILRIDRRNRIAIIEPGLTYSELQVELAKHGMRVSTPLMPRGNKSVITSLLEREPSLISRYQWSLMEPLRSMEVIWGDGSKFWTGEAGEYIQDLDEQQKIHRSAVVGMGPGPVDYYRILSAAQGSMGIVTWASIKCELLPSVHELLFIPADRLEDLIDCLYDLVRVRLGDELFIVNNAKLAYMSGKTPEEIQALKKQLPPWILLAGVAGREYLPKERVSYQKKDIFEIAQKHSLNATNAMTAIDTKTVLDLLNKPSKEPDWKIRYKGLNQDIFFITTIEQTPDFTNTMKQTAEDLDYTFADVGIYIQPQHQGACCHCEFSIPYTENDIANAKNVYETASIALLKQGAYYSRPYGIWSSMVYNDDTQNTILLKKIKKLFDPNNVLNPGKLCFQEGVK